MIRKGSVVKLSRKGLKNDPEGMYSVFRVEEIQGRKVLMRSISTLSLLWIVTMPEVIRVNNPRTLRWARAQQRRRS